MTRPLIATTGATLDTTNGGKGYKRTDKGELFIAAVSSFADHPERIRALTEKVALDDPAWVLRFDRWLRDEAHIRTSTIEVACAFVHSRLEAGVVDETGPGPVPGLNRTAINVACLRADEPAEVIAHWRRTYGRTIPMPVKRGVADAVRRLYVDWAALKYDTDSAPLRMGDVIELVHPRAKDTAQGALFEYLINRRHGWKDSSYLFSALPMVKEVERLRALPKATLRKVLLDDPGLLQDIGMTWENLSSLGPMDKEAWEAVIPTMGYMALLRNLRNFDNAGISHGTFEKVTARLSDSVAVERSRQFPFRFLSAFKNSNARWHPALNEAVNHSLRNVPELSGRTLIMVDCSVSMRERSSARSEITRKEQAALFGVALQARCEDPTLVAYGDTWAEVKPRGDVLSTAASFRFMGGTKTAETLRHLLNAKPDFDRVVIITDEQANAYSYGAARVSVTEVMPPGVWLYSWNLGGHAVAHGAASEMHHEFGGLTDQAFRMIPLIESGVTGDWPF